MNDLIKDSLGSIRGKALYAISQALYYIILARILGAASFGVFAALIAFIGFFQPFLGMGMDSIMVRDIAREPGSYSTVLGRSLVIYAASGIILLGLACLVNFVVFIHPFNVELFLFVIAGEFLFRVAELGGRAFQGLKRIHETANLWFFVSFTKLVAVFIFWLTAQTSLQTWSLYYIICAVITVGLSWLYVFKILGRPRFISVLKDWEPGEGLAFSATYATEKIYYDVDKFMLLKLSSDVVAGIYAAAYQFIKVAFYPVLSVLIAAYPRFFERGEEGIRPALRLSFSIMKYSAVYGILAGVGLYLVAPLIPLVLGAGYAGSVQVLRWLAVVPFIQTIYNVQAEALTGSDHQKLRSLIQMVAVLANIALNFWLIPVYSWWGAVIATIVSEGLLVLLFSGSSIWFWIKN